MLTKDHYFTGRSSHDEVVLFVRRHWISFLPWIVGLLVMMLAGVFSLLTLWQVFGGDLTTAYRDWLIIGTHAYLMLTMAIFLTSWISYYFDVTIITRTHLVVINQEGFFNRKTSEQSLLRVQDVSARMKGIFQTFFQFGTVFVETAGDAPNFEMNNIPMPNRMANTILRLHDKLISRGEREMEMVEGEGVLRPSLPQEEKPPAKEGRAALPSRLEEEQVAVGEEKETVTLPSPEERSYSEKESLPPSSVEEGPPIREEELPLAQDAPTIPAKVPPVQPQVKTDSLPGEEGELEEGKPIKL